MKKYWAIFKAMIQNSFIYRASSFMWSLGELFDTVIFLFIWIAIFGEGQKIGGFTLPETVTYLIGVGLVGSIINTWVHYSIEEDVRVGRLSGSLLKPLSYPLVRLVGSLADKPMNVMIKFVVYFFVAIFYSGQFYLNPNPVQWLVVLIIIGLAFFINYLIWFCLGCLSFWFTVNRGFAHVFQTVTSFFAGGFAPLTFFPPAVQVIAAVLPFSYTKYFPMLVYLNRLSGIEIIRGIGIQVAWLIGLFFLARTLWRKGVRKYEGVGI